MYLLDATQRQPKEGKITNLADQRQQCRRLIRGTAYLLLPSYSPLAVRILEIERAGVSIVAASNAPVNATCGLRFSLPYGLDR